MHLFQHFIVYYSPSTSSAFSNAMILVMYAFNCKTSLLACFYASNTFGQLGSPRSLWWLGFIAQVDWWLSVVPYSGNMLHSSDRKTLSNAFSRTRIAQKTFWSTARSYSTNIKNEMLELNIRTTQAVAATKSHTLVFHIIYFFRL